MWTLRHYLHPSFTRTRDKSPLWRPRKWAVLGADWFCRLPLRLSVSWPIGECSLAAWQLGRKVAPAAWSLAVSWSFIHGAAIAINFGILTFTLFVWGLSAANAANTSRLHFFFFFLRGMLAPDKTFCILNLHWNFLTLRDLFLFILYVYIVDVCRISKVDLLITRNESPERVV